MQLKILGIGNTVLLAAKVKTLDDAALLNFSALARLLGTPRSTFLSKIASVGFESAILHYVQEQKLKEVS